MPKIFRTMWEENGSPAVGAEPHKLGVCIPVAGQTNGKIDISPDPDGIVHPYEGGLSVAKSLDDLLPHLVPKRLKHIVEGASGSNLRYVWSMGNGSFSEGGVAHLLILRLKPERDDGKVLGLVEPAAKMLIADYQTALAATRPQWSRAEPL